MICDGIGARVIESTLRRLSCLAVLAGTSCTGCIVPIVSYVQVLPLSPAKAPEVVVVLPGGRDVVEVRRAPTRLAWVM